VRAHEPVRLLDVLPVDERVEKRAVRGVEVARRRREEEGGHDEAPERELAGEPRDGDGEQDRGADQVGRDQNATAVPAVRDEAAVEPEDERGNAVREAHSQDSERPASNANHMSAMYWSASPSSLAETAA
jgi:hypothetical protein